MYYTPKELEKIDIKGSLFYGYCRSQVDCILEKVHDDYMELKKMNEHLKEECISMKEIVQHYKTIEEALQHTLIIAQKTSETITENANQQAKTLILEAELKAEQILCEAGKKVDDTRLEYEEVKKRLSQYKAHSQALVHTMQDFLETQFTKEDQSSGAF